MKDKTVANPANMAVIQKFHLQPRYREIKPPAIGPTTGPKAGKCVNFADSLPRQAQLTWSHTPYAHGCSS